MTWFQKYRTTKILKYYHFSKLKKAINIFKGALSGLRQFLATESPLKTMKNPFYFTLEALFVLKVFKFLS